MQRVTGSTFITFVAIDLEPTWKIYDRRCYYGYMYMNCSIDNSAAGYCTIFKQSASTGLLHAHACIQTPIVRFLSIIFE